MVDEKQQKVDFVTKSDLELQTMNLMDQIAKLNNIKEADDDIIVQCDGMRIRMYAEGEYKVKEGEDMGETRVYEKGIELKTGGIKMNVSATQLLLMMVNTSKDVIARDELQKRGREEAAILKGALSW